MAIPITRSIHHHGALPESRDQDPIPGARDRNRADQPHGPVPGPAGERRGAGGCDQELHRCGGRGPGATGRGGTSRRHQERGPSGIDGRYENDPPVRGEYYSLPASRPWAGADARPEPPCKYPARPVPWKRPIKGKAGYNSIGRNPPTAARSRPIRSSAARMDRKPGSM